MININLFGGPGTGKSSSAAGLFHKMKNLEYKVEYITEYAKELVYGNDFTKLSDQLLVLGKQRHRMFRLENGVDFLIHDSPFIMGLSYVYNDIHIPRKEYEDLVVKMFNSYNNVNIFLERDIEVHRYQEYGRTQTIEEAIQKDRDIKQLLMDNNIDFTIIKISNNTVDDIFKTIQKESNEAKI